MKYVVIGGGIAGLAIGAFLERKGREVVICEKQSGVTNQGHAFLLHADAVSVLNELNLDPGRRLPGELIRHFSLRRPDGNEVRAETLEGWTCMKRTDLLEFMDSLVQPSAVCRGRNFSHFLRENGRVVAAVFSNGTIEYGDIFIGCDGGKSKVRDAVFGSLPATTIMVKEIVGIAKNSMLWPRHRNSFVKFQHDQYGLSFGMIPTGPDEFVWFMQFDPCRGDISGIDHEQIRKFVIRSLSGFPSEVSELLRSNDFSRTYVWNTRDFDLLPAFHRDNIVLVGDAAHQALPFSSSGTTNAIVGAAALSHALDNSLNLEAAFQQYYSQRAPVIREHVRIGRELR
ncbi:MAG TPA: FAD-dependent monooxygenase, partial [Puia sp.]|nr:FAD-dependent monooxygenase [Puia sp.]